MRLRDLIASAIQGITVHKGRAVLTVIGVVIGVMSIMTVMSLGAGAEQLVLAEVQSFGPTNLFVLPGREPSGITDFAGTLLADSLVVEDFKDLEDIANVERVVPFVFSPLKAEFDSETFGTTLMGSTEEVQQAFSLDIAEGRFFDRYDVSDNARVAVIGERVKEELFGAQDAVGEKIRMKGISFRVVGVLGPEGQSFTDLDAAVFVPYGPAQQDVFGIRYFHRIVVEASSVGALSGVVADIEQILRDNHNIDDPEKDDFFVQTQDEIAEQIGTITSIITALLASVAGISLIVGGVGIMNVMFVSVNERTKEIGLRKALGATNSTILNQFLLEASLLTIGGGIVGIGLGVGISYVASWAATTFAGVALPFIISWAGAVLGVVASVVVGLGFGVVPARSAAQKSPMEAMNAAN